MKEWLVDGKRLPSQTSLVASIAERCVKHLEIVVVVTDRAR